MLRHSKRDKNIRAAAAAGNTYHASLVAAENNGHHHAENKRKSSRKDRRRTKSSSSGSGGGDGARSNSDNVYGGGNAAVGRALAQAIASSSRSSIFYDHEAAHSQTCTGEGATSEKSKNQKEGQQQQQRKEANKNERDPASGGSSSCTASTASLSSSNISSSPLTKFEMQPPRLPTQQKPLQQKQPQSQSVSRHRQSPSPSLTSFLSSSSQHSASNAGNTSFIIDDDQIIARIENECIKLSLAMSMLRKYTPEWFLLETQLKNATEELEAAKEDRDLHFFSGSSSPSEVGSIRPSEVGSAKGSVMGSEEAGGGVGNGGVGNDTDHEEEGGIGIPETVLLPHDLGGPKCPNPALHVSCRPNTSLEVMLVDGGTKAEVVNSHYGQEQNSNTHDEIRLEYEEVESELEKVPKFSPKWFQLKEELVELSITLNAEEYEDLHDKPMEIEVVKQYDTVVPSNADKRNISAEGTNLLHSLAGNNKEGEKNDANNNSRGSYRKKGLFRPIISSSRGSSSSHGSPLSSRSSLSPISPNSSPLPPQGGRVVVQGSISPYPTSNGSTSNSSSCLSPYHNISNGSGSAASRSSRSNASHNYCYSRKTMLGDHNELSYNGDDNSYGVSHSKDRHVKDLAQTITDLKAQYVQASDKLQHHPRFSKEWFDLKTKTVCLENRLEELEHNLTKTSISSHSLGDSSSSSFHNTKNNKSCTSGWSSGVWSESEEEIMDYADELECVMVREALKLQHCHSSSYDGIGSDEDEFEYDGEVHMMMQEEEGVKLEKHLNLRIDAAAKIQALVRGRRRCNEYGQQGENATIIQSFLRKEHTKLRFQHFLTSVRRIQCAWRRHHKQEIQQILQEEKSDSFQDTETGTFDSMLDELDMEQNNGVVTTAAVAKRKAEDNLAAGYDVAAAAAAAKKPRSNEDDFAKRRARLDSKRKGARGQTVMLGDVADDELEKQHFNAMIIQEQWSHHIACRPLMSTRIRAVRYHRGLVGGSEEQRQQLHTYLLQEQQHYSHWQIFSAILIQGRWRGYCARQSFLHLIMSCATKIQSLIRGRRQFQQFTHQREKMIVIQSFLRKEWASLQFKHMLHSTVIIQRLWRKSLRDKSAAVAIAAKQQPEKTEFESLFNAMGIMRTDEWDGVTEKQNFKSCRPLVSTRRRSVQYRELTQGETWQRDLDIFAVILIQTCWRLYVQKKEFQYIKSSVVKIQAMVRSKRVLQSYYQQQEKSIVIQWFVRKYWIATGQVYTHQREVFFHSAAMGIRLQRGKDGFVRVLSVVDSLTVGSSIMREGTISPGDMVMEVAGIDVRSPITRIDWGEIVEQIRNAPRPMKFVVASGTRQRKAMLLDECHCVLIQLQSLISAVRIQRVWRKNRNLKRAHAENRQASIVIQSHVRQWLVRCFYNRELEKAALLAECKAMLSQLEMLRAATVIQSHTRRRLAHSSFRYKRESSIRIQESPSPPKREKEIITLSMQLCQPEQFSQECVETADKILTKQSELREARKHGTNGEESEEISPGQDGSDVNPKKPINFWLLREQIENTAMAPVFPQNAYQSPSKKASPKRTQPDSTVESPVTSWAQEDGSPGNEESESVLSARLSVASMRQTLEGNGMKPIFPQNEVNTAKKNVPSADSPEAPIPKARAGEMWSTENELRNVKISKNSEMFERSESARSLTPVESVQSPRLGKEKRLQKKEKKVTLGGKMRNLSIECMSLSARMKRLPKFSPEWTLSKLEMKLISEELEYLYAKSIAKGAQL